MIDLIVDYDLKLDILDSIDDKKFEGSDRMEYSEFEKEVNEYGKKATINKYGLHEFITEDKPLGYFMLLWDRVHRGWSTPYEIFSKINDYKIIEHKFCDTDKKLMGYYDLLSKYVDELFGIELGKLDNYSVNKLFEMMNSDNKVVLLKEGMAVFAW